MKICSRCNTEKNVDKFSKSSRYGLQHECKQCSKDRRHDKKALAYKIHRTQSTSSVHRGHRPPEYTRKELYEWLMSQTLFHELHQEWVQSGYIVDLVPSVDRILDSVHYCFGNIQLMTWKENRIKGHQSIQDGLTIHSKGVIQLSRDGEYIAEYVSALEAERQTSISASHIGECRNNNRKSAGGYLWIHSGG